MMTIYIYIFSAFSDNQWRRSYKVNDTYAQPTQQNDRTERLGYTTGYGSGLSVNIYS